ncbi:MAG: ABC transporter permease [Micromonosporaceae bacterium]
MRQRLTAIWVIACRELISRGRSKAFRISSVFLLLGLIAGIVIPAVTLRGTTRYTVAVASAGGADATAAIRAQAAAAKLTVTTRAASGRAAAAALVNNGKADAAVVGGHEVIWKSSPGAALAPVLSAALTSVAITQRAARAGLSPGSLQRLLAPPAITVVRLHPQRDRTPEGIVAMIGMILLFVALNFYGAYVLTGVVEEKSSRVVEVLLARVRPADLLAGKVVGIGMLGIGQFAALGAAAAVTLQFVRPPQLPAATLPLIASVVLWFILGYSFYSVVYGALGSLASRTEDAQAAVAPLTAVLLLFYFGAFAALARPAAWWVTALSLFPPSAPMFMPLRSALVPVPAWQAAAAVVLMLLAIAGLVRAGGRLYRGAVLHTGGRLRLRQAWRSAAR